jgi:hypothetical protein
MINLLGKFSFHIDSKPSKWKTIIVVGTIVFVLFVILTILGILWWKDCLGGRISREKGNKHYANLDEERINTLYLRISAHLSLSCLTFVEFLNLCSSFSSI